MEWYLQAWRKYFVLQGRASRTEYWCFVLINYLIVIVLALFDLLLDSLFGLGTTAFDSAGILAILYSLAVWLPSIAVMVRRLHDTDRSGWWILLCLIPLIGFIVLFIFALLPSTPDANRYGPTPASVTTTV